MTRDATVDMPMDRSTTPAGSPRGHPLRRGLSLGVEAAKANLRPAVALWAVGMAILAAYYGTDAGRAAMDRLAEFRSVRPVAYAMVATALFGGVIPWLVMRGRASSRARATWGLLAFMAGVWAEKGLEVHLLYEGLAALVGDSPEPGVIAAKVALDQGLYVTLWACPSLVLAYRLHDHGYRWRSLGVLRSRRWWAVDLLPVLLANWAVWTPAVAMIYALPLALQLPAQNLVLCFWSLVLMFMTDRKRLVAAG